MAISGNVVASGNISMNGVFTAQQVQSQNFSYNSGVGLLGPGDFEIGGTNNNVSTTGGGSIYGSNTGAVGGDGNSLINGGDDVTCGGKGNVNSATFYSFIGGGLSNSVGAVACNGILGGDLILSLPRTPSFSEALGISPSHPPIPRLSVTGPRSLTASAMWSEAFQASLVVLRPRR